MPRVPIHNVGVVGIVKDVKPHMLPPEAWSDGSNVRFVDGAAVKAKGFQEVFDPPSIAPFWAMAVRTPSTTFWVYTNKTAAFAYNSATHSDITNVGGAYIAGEGRDWNGGLLGGVPVLNNGADPPQLWATVAGGTPLVDLTNWPAATTCKILRPFKSFLVALNITESGTTKPHRVKWSDSADPGTVPSSWDETDATKDTGEVDLTDVNSGPILEGLPFGAVFMIYKEDSVWSMRFVGGQSIFAFSNILTTSGILGARCVASVDKGKLHFLHTGDDLVAFDGQDVISVIDKKLRRFLLSDLDSANFENSFCFDNVALDEACFVYPTNGQTLPDKCVVWNYRDNTTSVRAFQGNFAALGIIEELTAGDWNSDTEAWDNDLTPWSEALRRQILVPDSANTKLYQLEVTDQANGVDMTSFLERTGLGVVGKDRQGNPKVDIGVRKLVRRIWPKIRGGPVNIQVGVQEEIDGVITYQPAQSFDPATQKYLDFTANGRLIAVRFDATCNCSWQLEGYDLELEVLGEH